MGEHSVANGPGHVATFTADGPAGSVPQVQRHENSRSLVSTNRAHNMDRQHIELQMGTNVGQGGVWDAAERSPKAASQRPGAQPDQVGSTGAMMASSRRRSSRRPSHAENRTGAPSKRHASGARENVQADQTPSFEHGAGAHAANGCSSGLSGVSTDSRISKMLQASKARMLLATEIRALLQFEGAIQERPPTDTPDWAIYRECPKQRRRARNSDRWANSGGMKGSRDLPYNSPTPYVRRRYGSVFVHKDTGQKGKRYYEYTLLSTAEDGSLVEDKTKTLFHILPSPGETDRGRRVTPEDTLNRPSGSTHSASCGGADAGSSTTGSATTGSGTDIRHGKLGGRNKAPSGTQQRMAARRPRGQVVAHARARSSDVQPCTMVPSPARVKAKVRSLQEYRQPLPKEETSEASYMRGGQGHDFSPLAQNPSGSMSGQSHVMGTFAPPAPRADLAQRHQQFQYRRPYDAMEVQRCVSESVLANTAPLMQYENQQQQRDSVATKNEVIQQTFSFEEPLPKRPAWSIGGLPGRSNTWDGSSADTLPISGSDDLDTSTWMTSDYWSSGEVGQNDFDSQYNQIAAANFTTLVQGPTVGHAMEYHAGQLVSAPSPTNM